MKIFLSLFLGLFLSSNLFAITKIDITKGNMDPLPIAITDIVSGALDGQVIGHDITKVIGADLERSGLFRPIPKDAFIENIYQPDKHPNFTNWRQINAAAIVTGSLKPKGSEIEVNFRLWDVYGENQIAGKSYTATKANWRRIAHKIADEIYRHMTGEEGYFDSRIVYVAESGPGTKRMKRLAIMDQDGENQAYLSDGNHLVLTPRFSPSSHQLLYMSYAGKTPSVHLRDLASGKDRVIGNFNNMTFAPRFSPDGRRAVMSLAKSGQTDLYMVDLASGHLTRLTENTGINTSPSFSPDGNQIIFNSDRGGQPKLYIMNADGSNQTRISFGDGTYGNPVWSPRGDLISFTKIKGGEFFIGVMKSDGSGERLLTNGYLVEGQSWAPNGRVLVFTRQQPSTKTAVGRSSLYTIDVTGYNERHLPTPGDASDPAWSPLL